MQTTQHSPTPGPVYLHPAACTSPQVVDVIQKRTGLLVIVTPGCRLAPAKTDVVDGEFGPFGGDAA
jgi:hypothetical protein